MKEFETELEVAKAAVMKGAILAQKVAQGLIDESTLEKKDKSPVTAADFGVQGIVLHEILKEFPHALFVAEEDAVDLKEEANAALLAKVSGFVQEVSPKLTEKTFLSVLQQGQYEGGAEETFWTLDPIDGTKGFIRKEQYAIALALVQKGEVVLGVLGCPNLPDDEGTGCLFYAVRGQGAFVQSLEGGEPRCISVQDISSATEASFCESVESGHSSHDDSAKIAELLGVTQPPVRMDSQCKYASVARGESSIYLRLPTRVGYQEKIWDHGGGCIIVEEAGGRISDVDGEPLDFSQGRTLAKNRGVVVAPLPIFEEVIAAVKKTLRQPVG